uniref:Transmembrane protein n=1 Tax=Heligmosomoides polygyrus TaxID=6339 RepID=A0A183GXC0_HELPZ
LSLTFNSPTQAMPSITTCKANLTKACTALAVAKGKIHASLITPVDASDSNQPQILDARRLNIQAAIADLTSAIRTVQERRQMFLATVEGFADPEADNAAFENYMQETPVNDAVVDAESILSTLNHSLDEVQLLIERSATTIPTPQLPYCTTIQLSKYKLQPFDGDITKFQRFWGAFQLAVHNNPNIPPLEKYLQLQSLLTGDAIMVLDDVDPADNNYLELPYTCSSNSSLKPETRVPSSVAPGLASQLYFTVFVDTIRAKLHELEYQSNSQFDLDQIMRKLDHIIISQERPRAAHRDLQHLAINALIAAAFVALTIIIRHVAIQMPHIEFAVISISAGSAFMLVIQLPLVLIQLATFVEETTIVSCAE